MTYVLLTTEIIREIHRPHILQVAYPDAVTILNACASTNIQINGPPLRRQTFQTEAPNLRSAHSLNLYIHQPACIIPPYINRTNHYVQIYVPMIYV
ncbi:hypothetical protein BDA96_03G088500 [Sorghum bicolor]|uniref:Uncharacterized protein n=2 Tax=Sorghum bicolor TaxID=4558 RepID=A0A921ULN9_SORBI|nr:hypothetical protein BDA96_03G088500 [Sorghum bicolor]KXG31966.1 hypothetical protein SORBI_3003G084700 [Sorghum bicolor]